MGVKRCDAIPIIIFVCHFDVTTAVTADSVKETPHIFLKVELCLVCITF